MYAHHNGTSWTTEAIDSPYYAFDTSIDLDSGGNAHITYSVYNSSGNFYNLRYSYHNGSEWVQEDVRDYSSGWYYYILPHRKKQPDKAEQHRHPPRRLLRRLLGRRLPLREGKRVLVIQPVDDYGGWITTGGERAISLAIDSTDGLHVAYFDISGYSLEYAQRGPGESTWTKATVHDQGSHYRSEPRYPSRSTARTGPTSHSTTGRTGTWSTPGSTVRIGSSRRWRSMAAPAGTRASPSMAMAR